MLRLLVLIIFCVSVMSGCSGQKSHQAPESIPEFTFFNIVDNQPIMRTSLAIEGNIVFIFFDTGCVHCRNEIAAIGKNFGLFKNATFYLISQQDKDIVIDFMVTYGKELVGKPNVHTLLDRQYEFLPKFKPIQYPAMYVYGQDRKLKTYLDGENPLDRVVEAVNQ